MFSFINLRLYSWFIETEAVKLVSLPQVYIQLVHTYAEISAIFVTLDGDVGDEFLLSVRSGKVEVTAYSYILEEGFLNETAVRRWSWTSVPQGQCHLVRNTYICVCV